MELERGRVIVPHAEPGLVGLQRRLDLDEGADEPGRARLVGEADVGADPGGAGPRHLRNASGSAFVVDEVVQLQLQRRLERGHRLHRRGGARHVEDAERIFRDQGVAPGPEKLPAVDGILDAVAADDARFLPVELLAQLLAFGVQAGAGQSPQPLCDDGAFDLDLQRLARLRDEAEALEAEAILGRLVAVPVHVEPGLAPHEFREVEGDDAGVVAEEADLVHRAELDQGHRPARALFDDLDSARIPHRRRGPQQHQAQVHAWRISS